MRIVRNLSGAAAALAILALGAVRAPQTAAPAADRLTPPPSGPIPVAFVLSQGAVMIDFAGPWEVFQDVYLPHRGKDMDEQMPFRLYTVAESKAPIRISGGLQVVPDYTFGDAPPPKVVVIPAQGGATPTMREWIQKASTRADMVMSVCTGAFVLADTGLLNGKSATTHHGAYKAFAMKYPDVRLEKGMRFVENGSLATAGGLSSGIDLALRVVERYFGREAAQQTAFQMEYLGEGWTKPQVNAVFAVRKASTDAEPLCPVCEMEVDKASAPTTAYKKKTYYFCSSGHKEMFDAAPEKYLEPGS
ncbi:MAG TPA: DJ-1/PfpI family protein [Thermoanaerobaculia bacterium]|nr:DJ-1/PfpI family protein [Thermoanaerobaculia bacterium]